MKWRKPFRPNTKNIRPMSRRAVTATQRPAVEGWGAALPSGVDLSSGVIGFAFVFHFGTPATSPALSSTRQVVNGKNADGENSCPSGGILLAKGRMPPQERSAAGQDPDHWPPQIKYIVGNEAAERFSYYGMKSILALYITVALAKTKDE